MRRLLLLLLPAVVTGCGSSWGLRDEDGDGKTILDGDCWDSPEGGSDVGPDAAEVWYDGVDQDCDGGSDFDKDGDGFESAEFGGDDCWDDPDVVPDEFEALNGFAALDAASVNPDAGETFYDGIDADCDGGSDFDQDGDGYDTSNEAYRQRDGSIGDDCYDSADLDAYPESGDVTTEYTPEEINPGADDTWYDGTDQNCDAESDYDQDGDGYNLDSECDDTDPEILPNPEVEEVWYNDVDENCDGNRYDKDLDGFDSAEYGGDDCWDDYDTIPDDFVAINDRSQPTADQVHPDDPDDEEDHVDAPYDAVDADCAGDSDFDYDLDGVDTDELPDRDGTVGEDCDDDDAGAYPGADDTWYDGIDSDCAGDSDYDADGDGYDIVDEISTGTDCDDARANVNPGATESCSTSYDDNCDDEFDAEDATNCVPWYYDGDSDGYGSTTSECWCDGQTATGFDADNADDCDDDSSAINPSATEVCDAANTDEDCDSLADNNDASAASSGKTRFYHDDDEDDYGDDTHAGSLYCDNPSSSSQAWVTDNSDCDDAEEDTHPSATERVADSVDQDCDGGDTCYVDGDDDGYRNTDTSLTVDSSDLDCGDAGEGRGTDPATDCDDSDATVSPGDSEVVADGVDQDCDDIELCYVDVDNDGYRDDDTTLTVQSSDLLCTGSGEGAATEPATDCNDASSAINPAATEICDASNTDEDCDGTADNNDASASTSGKTRYYPDDDGDEYGDSSDAGTLYCDDPSTSSVEWSTDHTDCNDASTTISPAGSEVCDSGNTDEDCDGVADNNDSSAASSGKTRFYPDDDGDEYGDETDAGTLYCDDPSTSSVEWATTATDCNDSASGVNPGATEVCDASNTDEDCDDVADNADSSASSSGKTRYYPDDDGDEFGDETDAGTLYCDDPSTASVEWSTNHTDCDDASASINDDATEVCDASNTDEDCDGVADNNDTSASSSGKTRYYPDDDGDEYGDETDAGTLYCDDPSAGAVEWATTATDCDDSSSSVNPGATEVCDGSNTDEDCDDLADDADSSVSSTGKTRYYPDDDGDEYGDETDAGTLYCDDPSAGAVEWSTSHTDCDDGVASINPLATEVCDGADTDEDCDDLADDADPGVSSSGKTRYYPDDDGDEYGDDSDAGTLFCDDPSTLADEWNIDNTDCDDTESDIYPGAPDPTDGTLDDEDCDGFADDDDIVEGSIVITEFFVADDAGYEWFELYNTTGVDVSLDGWEFSVCYDTDTNESLPYLCDSTGNTGAIVDTFTLSGITIPADGYVIFCNDEAMFDTATCALDYTPLAITGTSGLQQDNGSVALVMGTTTVDGVDWWRTPSDIWPQDGAQSIQFSSDLLDATAGAVNDDWSSTGSTADQWCVSGDTTDWTSDGSGFGGTPGAANDDCTP